MSEQDPTESTPSSTSESGGADQPTPAASGGEASKDERNLALLAHLLGIFTSVIGALIIWLMKKESSKFLDHHGKQALNFQITILIGWAIGAATTFIAIGCIIVPAVFVINVIFCIIAALAASKGEWYRYPIAIPLLK